MCEACAAKQREIVRLRDVAQEFGDYIKQNTRTLQTEIVGVVYRDYRETYVVHSADHYITALPTPGNLFYIDDTNYIVAHTHVQERGKMIVWVKKVEGEARK